jgi:hypothetical protein
VDFLAAILRLAAEDAVAADVALELVFLAVDALPALPVAAAAAIVGLGRTRAAEQKRGAECAD